MAGYQSLHQLIEESCEPLDIRVVPSQDRLAYDVVLVLDAGYSDEPGAQESAVLY